MGCGSVGGARRRRPSHPERFQHYSHCRTDGSVVPSCGGFASVHATQRGDEIGHLGGVEHVVRSPSDFNHLRKDIGWILNGIGGLTRRETKV